MEDAPTDGTASHDCMASPSPSTDARASVPPPRLGPSLISRFSSICCCAGGSVETSGCARMRRVRPVTNRVLPVTSAGEMVDNRREDYLEVRPQRTVRVVHAMPNVKQKKRRRKRKMRTGETQSRAASGTADSSTDSSSSSSEEEEYWFENAAPRRMPIEQPAPNKRRGAGEQQNRIFNKFEPQGTPRIPGIIPPSSRTSGGRDGAGAAPTEISPTGPSSGQRLQRKVIVPPSDIMDDLDDDDDEDLVHEEPVDDDDEKEDHGSADAKESPSGVAAAIGEMSAGMILNITADSTERRPTAGARSPEPDTKQVADEPFPGNKSDDREEETSKVLVSGGHLGGMANVAFEDEEDSGDGVDAKGSQSEEPSVINNNAKEESASEHEADVGYRRERDVIKAALGVEEQLRQQQEQQQQLQLQQQQMMQNQRPILFMIHGVGGSASVWTPQIDHFTALGYEVVAPDLLGHGFSTVPDDASSYTFSKLFRDVLTIFDHYVYEGRPCALFAHSYGSSFAAALSRARPASVIMMILVASGGPTPLAPPPAMKSMPASVVSCLKPLLKCGLFRKPSRPKQNAGVRGRTIKFPEALDVPGYVLKHIMNGQHWPEGDATFHRRITIPVLLVYGLKDPLVSLVEMCEMERTIPKAYLELVPLAAHMVMSECPRELNVMSQRFVEKYKDSKPAANTASAINATATPNGNSAKS